MGYILACDLKTSHDNKIKPLGCSAKVPPLDGQMEFWYTVHCEGLITIKKVLNSGQVGHLGPQAKCKPFA